MSKIFLSYRFTGENPKHLDYILNNIKSSLEQNGHKISCSFHWEQFFRDKGMTNDEIYAYCLEKQLESDIFMPVITSNNKSYGMKIESDKAIELGQRYVTLHKAGTYQPEILAPSHQIITYQKIPEIFKKMKTFK